MEEKIAHAADDVGPASGVSARFEEDPSGAVSGRDGCGDAVGRVVGFGRAALFEERDEPQACGALDHVAGLLSAAAVAGSRASSASSTLPALTCCSHIYEASSSIYNCSIRRLRK